MSKKKKHEEFIEDLKNINSNIEVIGKYKTAKDYIDVKCKKCGGEWNPKANNLLNGNGCPYCCPTPRKILIGFNDIWTTNPDVAKLLANPEDGYKYTQYSGVKVDWKCPDCGYIVKNKKIGHVSYYHFSCPRCGDGISYPEKFIISLLNQINIEYEKEKEYYCRVYLIASWKRHEFCHEFKRGKHFGVFKQCRGLLMVFVKLDASDFLQEEFLPEIFL